MSYFDQRNQTVRHQANIVGDSAHVDFSCLTDKAAVIRALRELEVDAASQVDDDGPAAPAAMEVRDSVALAVTTLEEKRGASAALRLLDHAKHAIGEIDALASMAVKLTSVIDAVGRLF